jgi:hypothetical protein
MRTKKKSNVISIGDHIYALDKTLTFIGTKLDWTKFVQDKAIVALELPELLC